MSYEATGRIIQIGQREQKSSTFTTRDVVIEIEGRYPEYPKFQFTQDKCDLVDRFQEGDLVTISFDLRGREWQGKYFTSLSAWRIVPADGQPHKDAPADVTSAAAAFNAPAEDAITSGRVTDVIGAEEEDLDLPF